MAKFKRFKRADDGTDVFVNVELVTQVSAARGNFKGTLIHFDRENTVRVEGDPEDVMDQLSPAPSVPSAVSGTYRQS